MLEFMTRVLVYFSIPSGVGCFLFLCRGMKANDLPFCLLAGFVITYVFLYPAVAQIIKARKLEAAEKARREREKKRQQAFEDMQETLWEQDCHIDSIIEECLRRQRNGTANGRTFTEDFVHTARNSSAEFEEMVRRTEENFRRAQRQKHTSDQYSWERPSRQTTGMNREKALAILGLSGRPAAADIKAAYRKAAMKWHPDRNGSSKEAEEKFKEINCAHEYLTS